MRKSSGQQLQYIPGQEKNMACFASFSRYKLPAHDGPLLSTTLAGNEADKLLAIMLLGSP
eukprot:scaffold201133_cov15-Prasinocladus_malaysianus.AAC.1